mmetsp:Transcript_9337/g.28072  ORF Transcript_9337/g.28072 Transcript_9337/m.28072 type:complete len:283 (-) Transcript_9337:492-1340(-)
MMCRLSCCAQIEKRIPRSALHLKSSAIHILIIALRQTHTHIWMVTHATAVLDDIAASRARLTTNLNTLRGLDSEQKFDEAPASCVPIHTDVQSYDWSLMLAHGGMDVVMMDPPWSLAGANPTRGVTLGYSQMSDTSVLQIPIGSLQTSGILLVWVINAKYKLCLDMIEHWGYEVIDELVWVKTTKYRRLAKSHGYYLQHAKEVCIVARKGRQSSLHSAFCQDLLLSSRRGQSQKPEEIYTVAESCHCTGNHGHKAICAAQLVISHTPPELKVSVSPPCRPLP